jgi:hypothetical protein
MLKKKLSVSMEREALARALEKARSLWIEDAERRGVDPGDDSEMWPEFMYLAALLGVEEGLDG